MRSALALSETLPRICWGCYASAAWPGGASTRGWEPSRRLLRRINPYCFLARPAAICGKHSSLAAASPRQNRGVRPFAAGRQTTCLTFMPAAPNGACYTGTKYRMYLCA